MGLWLLDTANNDEPEGIWVHEQLLEQGVVQPCPADSLARQLVVKPRVEALVEEVLALLYMFKNYLNETFYRWRTISRIRRGVI